MNIQAYQIDCFCFLLLYLFIYYYFAKIFSFSLLAFNSRSPNLGCAPICRIIDRSRKTPSWRYLSFYVRNNNVRNKTFFLWEKKVAFVWCLFQAKVKSKTNPRKVIGRHLNLWIRSRIPFLITVWELFCVLLSFFYFFYFLFFNRFQLL